MTRTGVFSTTTPQTMDAVFSEEDGERFVMMYTEALNKRFGMINEYMRTRSREDSERMFSFLMELAFDYKNLQMIQVFFLRYFSVKNHVLARVVRHFPEREEMLKRAVADLIGKAFK